MEYPISTAKKAQTLLARLASICLALAGLCFADLVLASDTPAASEHSAKAVFSLAPDDPFTVVGKPDKLQATSAALQACLQAHKPDPSGGSYCELVSLDQHAISSATEIKQRASNSPHPLYLWRFQHDRSSVYIAGSMHVLKTGIYPLANQLQQAFDQSENLVLEVDLSTYSPQELQQIQIKFALLDQGQRLSQLLDEQTYAGYQSIAKGYGIDVATLENFKPSFVSQQLTIMAIVALGYMPQLGVENYFTTQAQTQDKQILELESLEFQMDLLLNQPMDTQVAWAKQSLAQLDDIDANMSELVGSWLAGDDEAILDAFTTQQGEDEQIREFMQKLIDQRNVGMAEKIEGYLQGDGSYFVLVGAGHLVGEESVIEMLTQKGFRPQRISSDQQITR